MPLCGEPLDFIARLAARVPKPRVNLTSMEQRAAMTWARRLKRVFGIDINECEKCKGPVNSDEILRIPAGLASGTDGSGNAKHTFFSLDSYGMPVFSSYPFGMLKRERVNGKNTGRTI